jgi:hypothetical protein
MKKVIFETEDALFQFDRKDVKRHLKFLEAEYGIDDVTRLLEFISTSSKTIIIPDTHPYFGYITLDLISQGKGSVTCKPCNLTYQSKVLKSFTVGHGRSPFDARLEKIGGIRNLFRRKRNLPGMGGKGYKCPEGHELIARVTWRT